MDDRNCLGVQKRNLGIPLIGGSGYFDLLVGNNSSSQNIDVNDLIDNHSYKDKNATFYSKKASSSIDKVSQIKL